MNRYSLQIKGEGLWLVREIPAELAERVVVEILSSDGVVETGWLKTKEDEVSGNGKIDDVGEFLGECGAARVVDKVAAVAWWLKNKKGVDFFGKRMVVEQFEAAGEAIPKNLSRDLAWAVAVGWVARKDGVRGSYYLTQKGREVVEKNFPQEEIKQTASRRR